MAVDSIISSVISDITSASTDTDTEDSSSLDKTDFLELLVVQMQNQDPLDPDDPSEYTSQLLNYSQLEQLINLNDGFDSLLDVQTYYATATLAGYVGQDATVEGAAIEVEDGEATSFGYTISTDADVTLNVYDDSGVLVDTVDLGETSAGTHEYTWDADGGEAGDGSYTFELEVTDDNGNEYDATTTVTGTIDSVVWEDGVPMLSIYGQLFEAGDIVELGNLV